MVKLDCVSSVLARIAIVPANAGVGNESGSTRMISVSGGAKGRGVFRWGRCRGTQLCFIERTYLCPVASTTVEYSVYKPRCSTSSAQEGRYQHAASAHSYRRAHAVNAKHYLATRKRERWVGIYSEELQHLREKEIRYCLRRTSSRSPLAGSSTPADSPIRESPGIRGQRMLSGMRRRAFSRPLSPPLPRTPSSPGGDSTCRESTQPRGREQGTRRTDDVSASAPVVHYCSLVYCS